jgi:hypothetical protein
MTFFRLTGLSLACALALPLLGCQTMLVRAAKPTPTLYAKPTDATVRVDVFEVPHGKQCAALKKARQVCVENFHQVLGDGLVHTLGQFMKPGSKDKADLVAEFRYLGFAQGNSPKTPGAYQLGLGWSFTLKRTSDGSTVVELKETTISPQELVRNQAEPVVAALINTVFEKIGAQLTQAEIVPKPPEPEPEPEVPAAPPPACVAGQTQECVGPGACKGGQSCLPDGSGFTECDCGSKKKKGSSGAAAPPAPRPAPEESSEGFQP